MRKAKTSTEPEKIIPAFLLKTNLPCLYGKYLQINSQLGCDVQNSTALQLAEQRKEFQCLKREREAAQYRTMSLMDASERMICLFLAGGYTVSMSPAELWIVCHF